jgi:putative ubiquitin-RnfH superfamily antitoxin RatB of RatAB toxin-antitoxin module
VKPIAVTVVLALSDSATEVALRLPTGATVSDALAQSGLAALHPELDVAGAPIGIFGRRVERDCVLADGDRVEIYRPLIADPKDARRRRARRMAPR